ncbi:3D domain-containing protein [Exiguobacterium sp. s193]|uniref:3D domain-containing protein n=1 Tax=Exiguobacterium sp. s193 TaxID=2751207 RepID=UPI001BE72A92|nr:3D domain-containing protein [Exiguobacterium sp. s193]
MKLKQIVLTIIFTFTGLILAPHMHTEAAQIGIGTEKKIVQNPLEMKRESVRLEKKRAAKRAAEKVARHERQLKEQQARAEREAKQKQQQLEKEQQQAIEKKTKKAEVKPVAQDNEQAGGRQETFETTAYTNDAALNGSYDGKVLTASGYDVTHTIHFEGRRIVAVDPRVIPLGTKVHVDGFGDAIALDTGGVIHGKIMDLMMETEQEAINWGRRSVKVTIYD